jgi:hypothetical protein
MSETAQEHMNQQSNPTSSLYLEQAYRPVYNLFSWVGVIENNCPVLNVEVVGRETAVSVSHFGQSRVNH